MTGFGLANLPYGVFSRPGESRTAGVRFGDHVLDLAAAGLGDDFEHGSLDVFMARGAAAWGEARDKIRNVLQSGLGDDALVPLTEVELHLPFAVADYVDFYSSIDHATNMGRLLRPDDDPLLPNWRHLPVGYHGRAGTVVVTGTPIRRPSGQSKAPDRDVPTFGPTRQLDIELELGFVVGVPSSLGQPVGVRSALDHVFGVVLVNDWSARDIQAWEYQPLGPFLGKSFATSISAWVVPLEALLEARVPGIPQDPPALEHLDAGESRAFDLELEVRLRSVGMAGRGEPPEVISRTNARRLYWSVEQQVAHLTSNGAALRTGDLLASGTISGPARDASGSLIERTWRGREPITLSDGSVRTFLEDGDEVVLRGWALGGTVELGEVRGTVVAGAEAE